MVCDKYHFLIKPFCYLFNKFWGLDQKVIFLGYKKVTYELPSNFSFISLGSDLGPLKWSNPLIKFFNNLQESHFILGLEDTLLTGPFNKNIFSILIKELSNPDVGRIHLSRDIVTRPHYLYKKIDKDFSIIEAKEDALFRVSLGTWSIWNKEYFLKYLTPNLSIWDFEKPNRGAYDGFHILGTKSEKGPPDNAPLDVTNAIWRGNSKRLNFHRTNYPHLKWDIEGGAGLNPIIIKEMKEKNIIPPDIETGIVFEKIWKSY